ncbi:MAG: DUF4846 domain-containing protein [Leptospiraceae bacterium]|nr:DUF4846 domain-containing protein [Leptospiraceae bacterium]
MTSCFRAYGRWATVLLLAALPMQIRSRDLYSQYPWLRFGYPDQRDFASIQDRFLPPPGYARITVKAGSYADWLRHLPLLPGRPAVHLYNNQLKNRQDVHAAVVAIDTGQRDLQQCADAILRLQAEYHFSRKQYSSIAFRYTSGFRADFDHWRAGYRPHIQGNQVHWTKHGPADSSWPGFRRYMNNIFGYAGSYSLARDSRPRPLRQIQIGDFFIQGGFPGHAVLVVDLAVHKSSGQKQFLLLQSYMPAQEMHVLKNPAHPESEWYDLPTTSLVTPEWQFAARSLRYLSNGSN